MAAARAGNRYPSAEEIAGKEFISFFRITFHNIGGVEVCQISIKPSPKPREAVEYCKHRWKI